MQGTIKRNNVLEPMAPYGCFDRKIVEIVAHGNRQEGYVSWPHTMSVSCRYDMRQTDERCRKDGRECNVSWDEAYLESLK